MPFSHLFSDGGSLSLEVGVGDESKGPFDYSFLKLFFILKNNKNKTNTENTFNYFFFPRTRKHKNWCYMCFQKLLLKKFYETRTKQSLEFS